MKVTKNNLFLGHRVAGIFLAIFCMLMTGLSVNFASAAAIDRSPVDRPDEVSGFQIHLVYVVPNGSTDLNVDTNGQIDAWVKEGNAWLSNKVGHSLQFDTFQGLTDVTFLSSKYRVPELCFSKCKTLSKLKDEYVEQNPNFDNSKTLLFILSDALDPGSCGWGNYASNLALEHSFGDTGGGCNWSSKTYTELSGPAKTIVHELVHTFGIHHVCMDNSDLMIGRPECTIDENTYGGVPLTLDSKRNQYIGSELAFGIDLLKMPIWSDGSGSKSYSEIKQISDKKYIYKLSDGTVYAVIGKQSEFMWDWEKDFSPRGPGVKCQFTSGLVSIIGTQSDYDCLIDVPNTLRAGKPFTVSQSWVEGPWHGEASIAGVLVRADYSSSPCTENTCFVGGTTTADYSCWTSNVKSMTLQQLVNDMWVDLKTVGTVNGSKCLNSEKYMNYPELTLNFEQTGLFVYRWFIPEGPGVNSYTDTPFAVIVNDENSAEPSQDEVASAQTKAIELGKAADALAAQLAAAKAAAEKAAAELKAKQEAEAKAAADKAAADKAAADKAAADKAAADKAAADLLAKQKAAAAKALANKKTTITCIKGKTVKKVTAVKPVCPKGYKKK